MPKQLLEVFAGLVAGRLPWPLFLYGPPGRGKSCAGLAFADHVPAARHFTMYELIAKYRTAYQKGPGVDWEAFSPHARYPIDLVVLDEVGTKERVADDHYECVHRMLDAREGTGLVLVSNLGPAMIGQVYDGRIKSRLDGGTVVELAGRDRRAD